MAKTSDIKNEKGNAIIEYAMILAFIALVILTGYPSMRQDIDAYQTSQAAKFSTNTEYPAALIP